MRSPSGRLTELWRNMHARHLLVLGFDAAITAFSFWLAMLLRFEGRITESYLVTLPSFLMLAASYRVLSNLLFRLHNWSFRFSGLADGARVAMSGLTGTGMFLLTIFLLRHPGPPRSVVVLELLLSTLGMAAIRFSPRLAGTYVTDWTRTKKPGALRTLIVGAGSAGEMLLRDLQRSPEHSYKVIGYVDDDPAKQQLIVGGKTVLGTIEQLGELAKKHRASQVLIAIPLLAGQRIREILSVCADLNLRFKILPVSFVNLNRRKASEMMQDLSPEDLLPREPIDLDAGQSSLPAGRVALVTGAAGSIGSEICVQLLRAGTSSLILVDINENGMYLLGRRLERDFPEAKIFFEVADVRDRLRFVSLFNRYHPNDVFHAAAHKHVPLMEAAPCEAIKNNVIGTRNVAEAAIGAGAERFVYISTDKAVRPTSVMGACKRVGEEMVRAMARTSETHFCAVRFGNVLGSAGSVVPIFQEQIANGGPVTVTHEDVRRYFMTISEAVALVLRAGYSDFGELCVLDMGEQLKIADLARHMVTMAGMVPGVDIEIEFTGLRPGEKIAEELLTEEEEQTRRVHDKIFVASCPAPVPGLAERIDELGAVAATEDEAASLRLLYRLVPSFTPLARIDGDRPGPDDERIAAGNA